MANDPFDDTKPLTKATHPIEPDLSWDSTHHTLGAGSTQAAPGNHVHKEYMPISSAPIAGNYVLKTGDSMSGKLQIDNSKGLTLHNPSNSVVSIGAQSYGGKYSLEVTDNWDADTGTLAPVRAGTPTAGEHLARVDWAQGSFATIGHTHAAPAKELRYITTNFGSVAATTVATVTLARASNELPIGVFSADGATNYTWGISFPNSTSFTLHLRNQSGSANNIGQVDIILGVVV